ncbi:MAG: precorrin-2 C(20)-methyltransferase, partial [Albidovulum sp.]
MGKVICVGLGPGDPELMSVRADRLVRGATHIAYFRKKGRTGQARKIVDGMLAGCVREYPMEYPVTTEIHFSDPEYNRALADFYDEWASRLTEISATSDVIVLCEGDPFFYGSFMHLHQRLKGRAAVEVVPGITGMSGCWTATGQPITWGDDALTVLMATLPEEDLVARARSAD